MQITYQEMEQISKLQFLETSVNILQNHVHQLSVHVSVELQQLKDQVSSLAGIVSSANSNLQVTLVEKQESSTQTLGEEEIGVTPVTFEANTSNEIPCKVIDQPTQPHLEDTYKSRLEKNGSSSSSQSSKSLTTNDLNSFKEKYLLTIKKLNRSKTISNTVATISHYQFNKAIILPGTNPKFVKTLYKFGLIQVIYPSPDLSELSELPDQLKAAVKQYFGITTYSKIFIRFYSAIAEVTDDKYYQPINLIKFGITKSTQLGESVLKDFHEDYICNQIPVKRAQGLRVIFEEMNRQVTGEDRQWVYYVTKNELAFTAGKVGRKEEVFKEWYEKVKGNKFDNSPQVKQLVCADLSDTYMNHVCNSCKEKDESTDCDFYLPDE